MQKVFHTLLVAIAMGDHERPREAAGDRDGRANELKFTLGAMADGIIQSRIAFSEELHKEQST